MLGLAPVLPVRLGRREGLRQSWAVITGAGLNGVTDVFWHPSDAVIASLVVGTVTRQWATLLCRALFQLCWQCRSICSYLSCVELAALLRAFMLHCWLAILAVTPSVGALVQCRTPNMGRMLGGNASLKILNFSRGYDGW